MFTCGRSSWKRAARARSFTPSIPSARARRRSRTGIFPSIPAATWRWRSAWRTSSSARDSTTAITSRNTPTDSTPCANACAPTTPERVAALTGIAKEDIVQLAREYATMRPAVIRLNYGVQRSERGGAAVRAIAALPALTGSWREVGGGLQLSTSQAFHLNRNALEMPELQMRSPLGREARIVNMSELGRALTQLDCSASEGHGGL